MTQIRPQGWARRVLLWQVLAEGCVEKKALVATGGREGRTEGGGGKEEETDDSMKKTVVHLGASGRSKFGHSV